MLCMGDLIILDGRNIKKLDSALWFFCRWAVRPAERCPDAGEGPRGRHRRSAVKLTPAIIPPDYGYVTGGSGQSFRRTESTPVDGKSGATMVYTGLFFLGQNPEIRLKIANNEISRNPISTAFL